MTADLGLNLAGVERVFELENLLDAMARKVHALERRATELKAEVERLEYCAGNCVPRSSLRARGALVRATKLS